MGLILALRASSFLWLAKMRWPLGNLTISIDKGPLNIQKPIFKHNSGVGMGSKGRQENSQKELGEHGHYQV